MIGLFEVDHQSRKELARKDRRTGDPHGRVPIDLTTVLVCDLKRLATGGHTILRCPPPVEVLVYVPLAHVPIIVPERICRAGHTYGLSCTTAGGA